VKALAGFREFELITGEELFIGGQSRFASRRQVHFVDEPLGFYPERSWASLSSTVDSRPRSSFRQRILVDFPVLHDDEKVFVGVCDEIDIF
jgi:hypothetical protein